MNFRSYRRKNLELNMTPMIDVVFLLLIFFMVTTTFNRDTELQIELPEAEGQQPKEKKIMIKINVDAQGNYYVNQHRVVNQTIEMLKKAILEASKNQGKPTLVIAADANASHQSVISVLDAARQLDFVRITFAAKTFPESRK